MNRDRWYDLNYAAAAYEMWAEIGPYKQTPIVRNVYIQASKLSRMLHNDALGISPEELRGEPASLNRRKKRGKLTVKVEQQYKKLLQYVEDAVQQAAEKEFGRKLTKAELKQNAIKFRARIVAVIKLMKEKYPVETA